MSAAPSVHSVMWLPPQQKAVFRKSPGKCFRYQQTNKGWSVICWSADPLLCSARQEPARAGVETELRGGGGGSGLWWMSLSAYCGPTMAVCSCRTLGGMIWAMLLPDLTYWHWGAHLSQPAFGSVMLMILLQERLASHRLPCTGDFSIKGVIHHLYCDDQASQKERGRAEIKQLSAHCFLSSN